MGLFGGLNVGFKYFLRSNNDWLWIMDDDAIPDKDALINYEKAISNNVYLSNSILYPAHMTHDQKYFTEPIGLIDQNKFRIVSKPSEINTTKIYEGFCGPNIGLIVPKIIVQDVGCPNSNLFFCGEYEYLYRIKMKGYKVFYNFSSKVFHKKHSYIFQKIPLGLLKLKKPLFVIYTISLVSPRHDYYEIRNSIYFARNYLIGKRLYGTYLNIFIQVFLKLFYSDKISFSERLKKILLSFKHGFSDDKFENKI